MIGNDLSDTNHFGGMKDSVHKQACLPKQTSESSCSVASQQNMDAISEICWQLNSVLTYLLFTEVPSKRFFKEKYCLECRLKFFFFKKMTRTRVWIDQRLNPWGLLSGSVANRTNRTKNQSNSIGRIVGNRTYSNWTFSVSSINRTRDFDNRTLSNQSNSIDQLVRFFSAERQNASRFNWIGKISLVCIWSSLKTKIFQLTRNERKSFC